ncbi:hypothetical protein Q9290_09215 [Oceanimonas sp. CHS3-5]|uniref:protein kinase domain-containing protein n=1 Tax=Oceanimonas sp. CHS3-5 TaxID=3068186 RepID=UPI00273EEAE9|nr:hypothetical protein [Oceanimonas sp. CHS3-5]MDP5292467.1 hypothetical protein [Oceanimonas sp. CHS3-5]
MTGVWLTFIITYSEYPITVSSYHYRAPELLLGMKQYDYSLDMWSFACIFAGLVCNSFPFVKGRDKSNVELLRNISGLLGENEFWNYIEKYGLNGVSEEILGAIVNPSEEGRLVLMRSDSALKSNLALDLISKVLKVDHQERLTAREAMEHPYFDEVRKT